jgi:predicted outer membrane repeat protein
MFVMFWRERERWSDDGDPGWIKFIVALFQANVATGVIGGGIFCVMNMATGIAGTIISWFR